MKTIYIVVGTTGEYSDVSYWDARAFLDSARAEAFRDALNAKAREIGVHMDKRRIGVYVEWEERERLAQHLRDAGDENATVDYTGVNYFVKECPLDDGVA